LGRAVAAPKTEFSRFELDVAAQLRPMPKDLSVVFVVDGSRSMDVAGIKAQLAVARSFVRHVPDAEIEVVVYRRRASRLFGRFVKANEFERLVAEAHKAKKLDPANGSAIDEGFALAAVSLKGRRGSHTIVALTDELLRARFDNKLAHAALRGSLPKTVVHMVVPDAHGGDLTERRDDERELSPLALKHHGNLLVIDGLEDADDKSLDEITLGLVRPIRIDQVQIVGPAAKMLADINLPSPMVEGTGIRELLEVPRAPTRVELKGKIWAESFRRVIHIKPKSNVATAGFVFSHDMHDDLSPEAMMRLARFGRAVTPVTSYLAIEPGVRPSFAGIDRQGRGLGMGGMGQSGSGFGIGSGHRTPPDLEGLLAPGVDQCVAALQPKDGWSVALTVDTTLEEVVDVVPKGKPSPMRHCVVEAAWLLVLDSQYDQTYESFDVSYP
jgi:hypothetical protein